MKRQRKFVAAIVAINMLATSLISPFMVKAEANYTDVQNSVNVAITEKNFYYYNMAFARIMELPEGYERDVLLAQLGTITDVVWTKDIAEIVQSFYVIVKEKSGREYDRIQRVINTSNLKEVDKQYLLNELNTWGRDTVWTDDYKKGIDAIIKVWTAKTEASAAEAEKAISELKVELNKEYLTELLDEAKNAVGLAALLLDGKYFDSLVNKVYVGDGKSVNLDLSKDTAFRTVTLKGNIKNLTINAPKADVVLEDANITSLNIVDIAGSSLYLKGTTKLQNLVVNDKDDTSRIVLQGKATVANAEIKSGTKLEVNVDKDVLNPFGKLIINTLLKKTVQLVGDFKETVVKVEKPAQLSVENLIKRIEIGKDAKDSAINVSKDAKISELYADAALKVDGAGTVTNITGSAKSQVVNNTTGNIPYIPGPIIIQPDTTAPVISLLGSATVNLSYGASYTDAGANATDNRDGDISYKIVKTIKNSAGQTISSIDTTLAGTYTIEYTVSDSAGNAAVKVTRTVTVAARPAQISDLNSGTNLPAGNYSINGLDAEGTYGSADAARPTIINGNLEINDVAADQNRSITLQNIKIDGTLTVDYGSGTIKLINVDANQVVIKNVGKNSFVVAGDSTIGTLRSEDVNNDAHIVVEGNGSISTVYILSGAQLETSPDATNPNPMGEINLEPEEPKTISLSGSFQTVNVKSSADITLAHNTQITNTMNLEASSILTVPEGTNIGKVEINSSSATDTFVLNGNMKNVDIKGAANIEVGTGTVQVGFSNASNQNTNIKVAENAKVVLIEDSVNNNSIKGDGTVEFRTQSSEANLVDVKLNGAKYDKLSDSILNIARNTTVDALIKSVQASDFAKVDVVIGETPAALNSKVSDGMKLRIVSEDTKQTHLFNLALAPFPTMAANYPVSRPGALSSRIINSDVKANQDGVLYVVAMAKGSPAPSSEQVRTGKGADEKYAINGRISVVKDTVITVGIPVPLDGAEYDLYFVLADTQGNLQASPSKTTAFSPVRSSSANDILKYRIKDKSYSFVFNNDQKYIEFHVPEGTDVTQLVPEITLSANAAISATLGAAADFSKPVNYLVTAQNGDTAYWTVKCVVDKKVLDSIAIKTPPTKRVYRQGEPQDAQLDLTSLVVEAKYNDGSTKIIENPVAEGFKIDEVSDNQVIIVSFEGKTAAFTIKVTPKPQKPNAPTLQELKFNDTNNTIELTSNMEYKLDDAPYMAYRTGDLSSAVLKGRHTLRVRMAAVGINPVSDSTTLEFQPSQIELDLQAIKNAAVLIQENYTPESWMTLEIAKGKPETNDTEMVDKTTAIRDAIAKLVTISAKIEEGLQAAKNTASSIGSDGTPYTLDSWNKFIDAKGKPETTDIEKTTKTKNIYDAISALVRKADENLQREKTRASNETKNKANYSAASWSVLSNALLMSEANDDAKYAKASAINSAIARLITIVDGNLQMAKANGGALLQGDYTTESLAALSAALGKPEGNDTEKNAKISAINTAISALKTNAAALSEELQIVKANAALLVQSNYTPQSWAVLASKLALPEASNTEKRSKISGINSAVQSLVTVASFVDANLRDAIVYANSLSQSDYTSDTWNALNRAVVQLPEDTIEHKLAKITEINNKVKALVTVVDDNLQKARNSSLLVQSDYTPAAWSKLTIALALPERNNTDKIAKTTAINDAVKTVLENKIVDLNLKSAKDAAAGLLQEKYTTDSWALLDKAKALLETNDSLKIVKTTSITNALASLVTKIDDNLIKEKEKAALRISTNYTSESWAKLVAALALPASSDSEKITKTLEISNALNTLELLDLEKPVIRLNPNTDGTSNVTIDVGAAYSELGATVTDNRDRNLQAVITHNINTSKVGVYEVKYNVRDAAGNAATEVIRKVYVVDRTAPVVRVKSTAIELVKAGDTYNIFDYANWIEVTDNYDRNLKVEITGTVDTTVIDEYTLTYVFADASGNRTAQYTRKVKVEDKTAPSIASIDVTTKDNGTVVIVPGNTQVIDLTSIITASGLMGVSSVDVKLNTSLKGQNDKDEKTGSNAVTAVLDFSASGLSSTIQDLIEELGLKTSGTVQEIEDMIQSVLLLASNPRHYDMLLKLSGTTLTLTDSAGNTAPAYSIITDQAMIQANNLVIKAEETKSQADLDNARIAVNALPNGSYKTSLVERLNAVETAIKLAEATKSVVKAENSKVQQDVDSARLLVNALKDGTDKSALGARLDYVQKVINATSAVVKAEGSKEQADVDSARTLVGALVDPDKTTLTQRLDAVQKIITDQLTYQQNLKKATDAVVNAETTKQQGDVNNARALVNALNAEDKATLGERLDAVQREIDRLTAQLNAATNAVIAAEATRSQPSIDNAKALVNALPDSTEKTNLINRISAVQTSLNSYRTQLAEAIHTAAALMDGTPIGTEPGSVPQAARDEFKNSITSAAEVKDNIASTQAQVQTQIEALAAATTKFNNSIIKDTSHEFDDFLNAIMAVADSYGNTSGYFRILGSAPSWNISITNTTLANTPVNELYTKVVDKIAHGAVSYDKVLLLMSQMDQIKINGIDAKEFLITKFTGRPHTDTAIEFLKTPTQEGYDKLVAALATNDTYDEIVSILRDMSLIQGSKIMPQLTLKDMTLEEVYIENPSEGTFGVFVPGSSYSIDNITWALGLPATTTPGAITVADLNESSIKLTLNGTSGQKTYWFNRYSSAGTPKLIQLNNEIVKSEGYLASYEVGTAPKQVSQAAKDAYIRAIAAAKAIASKANVTQKELSDATVELQNATYLYHKEVKTVLELNDGKAITANPNLAMGLKVTINGLGMYIDNLNVGQIKLGGDLEGLNTFINAKVGGTVFLGVTGNLVRRTGIGTVTVAKEAWNGPSGPRELTAEVAIVDVNKTGLNRAISDAEGNDYIQSGTEPGQCPPEAINALAAALAAAKASAKDPNATQERVDTLTRELDTARYNFYQAVVTGIVLEEKNSLIEGTGINETIRVNLRGLGNFEGSINPANITFDGDLKDLTVVSVVRDNPNTSQIFITVTGDLNLVLGKGTIKVAKEGWNGPTGGRELTTNMAVLPSDGAYQRTPVLVPSQVIVKNNLGTADEIRVSGLNINDVVRVYSESGALLAIQPLPATDTTGTEIIIINQLGQAAGSIYVTVQSSGKAESDKIEVSYAAEASTSAFIFGTVTNPGSPNSTPSYGTLNVFSQAGVPVASAGISGGRYKVEPLAAALADGVYTAIAYPSPVDPYTNSFAKSFTVVNGQVSPAADARMDFEYTNPMITGSLKKSNNQTSMNGVVEIIPQGAGVRSSVMVYNGEFRLGGLNDGVYEIKGSVQDGSNVITGVRTITISGGVVTPAEDANLVIQLGLDRTAPTLLLLNPPTVYSGQPINVSINEPGTLFLVPSDAITTTQVTVALLRSAAANGKGVELGVPANSYMLINTIGLQAGSYLLFGTDSANNTAAPISITITSDVVVDKTLRVTVKNPDKTVATTGEVHIVSPDYSQWHVRSVQESSFDLSIIPDGEYELYAKADKDGPYTDSDRKIISILNGRISPESVTSIELSFTNPVIYGVVSNPDGTLPNVAMVDVRQKSSGQTTIIVVEDGKYKWKSLEDGEYEVSARPNAETPYINSVPKTITVSSGKVTPASDAKIDLQFVNPMILGTVLNPDGTTENYGNVMIKPVNGGLRTTTSMSGGVLKIGALPDGTYELRVDAFGNFSGMLSAVRTITVSGGELSPKSDENLVINLQADNTPPVITMQSPTIVGVGQTIYAALNEQGMFYLVPEAAITTTQITRTILQDAANNGKGVIIGVPANESMPIDTVGLLEGRYLLFGADSANNIMAPVTITISAAVAINKTALSDEIAFSEENLTNAEVGTQAGQTSQAAVDALADAIEAAKAVSMKTSVTQKEIDDAVTALKNARHQYYLSIRMGLASYETNDITAGSSFDRTIKIGLVGPGDFDANLSASNILLGEDFRGLNIASVKVDEENDSYAYVRLTGTLSYKVGVGVIVVYANGWHGPSEGQDLSALITVIPSDATVDKASSAEGTTPTQQAPVVDATTPIEPATNTVETVKTEQPAVSNQTISTETNSVSLEDATTELQPVETQSTTTSSAITVNQQ